MAENEGQLPVAEADSVALSVGVCETEVQDVEVSRADVEEESEDEGVALVDAVAE